MIDLAPILNGPHLQRETNPDRPTERQCDQKFELKVDQNCFTQKWMILATFQKLPKKLL